MPSVCSLDEVSFQRVWASAASMFGWLVWYAHC